MEKLLYTLLMMPLVIGSHRVEASASAEKKVCLMQLKAKKNNNERLFYADSEYVQPSKEAFGDYFLNKQDWDSMHFWDGTAWSPDNNKAKAYTRKEISDFIAHKESVGTLKAIADKDYETLKNAWNHSTPIKTFAFKKTKSLELDDFFGKESDGGDITEESGDGDKSDDIEEEESEKTPPIEDVDTDTPNDDQGNTSSGMPDGAKAAVAVVVVAGVVYMWYTTTPRPKKGKK